MTRSFFDAYGDLTEVSRSPTQQAGRYASQAEAERLILADVTAKLGLLPQYRLLEIGCGPGNLLIPLAFNVRSAVGIDHPKVVAMAQSRFRDDKITWIGAEFPGAQVEGRFDRILIYSVIHCLPTVAAVERMIDAAVNLLEPGGRLLVGDIPNKDRKKRFQDSESGRAFEAVWRAKMANQSAEGSGTNPLDGVISIGMFDDAQLLDLVGRYRAQGLHAYVLPQPGALPFGHTREDLLIERLA